MDQAFVAYEDEPELEVPLSELIIDAITGVGLPTLAIAIEAEKKHLATFVGNQHNTAWKWRREKLEALSEAQLQALYYNLKVAQRG